MDEETPPNIVNYNDKTNDDLKSPYNNPYDNPHNPSHTQLHNPHNNPSYNPTHTQLHNPPHTQLHNPHNNPHTQLHNPHNPPHIQLHNPQNNPQYNPQHINLLPQSDDTLDNILTSSSSYDDFNISTNTINATNMTNTINATNTTNPTKQSKLTIPTKPPKIIIPAKPLKIQSRRNRRAKIPPIDVKKRTNKSTTHSDSPTRRLSNYSNQSNRSALIYNDDEIVNTSVRINQSTPRSITDSMNEKLSTKLKSSATTKTKSSAKTKTSSKSTIKSNKQSKPQTITELNQFWTNENEADIADLANRGLSRMWLHAKSGSYYTDLKEKYTIILIVLGICTSCGAYISASFAEYVWVSFMFSALGIVTTFLVKYVDSLELSGEIKDHKYAGSVWSAFVNSIRRQLSVERQYRYNYLEFSQSISKEYDMLLTATPNIGENIIRKFTEKFEQRTSYDDIDTLHIKKTPISERHTLNSSISPITTTSSHTTPRTSDNSDDLENTFLGGSANDIELGDKLQKISNINSKRRESNDNQEMTDRPKTPNALFNVSAKSQGISGKNNDNTPFTKAVSGKDNNTSATNNSPKKIRLMNSIRKITELPQPMYATDSHRRNSHNIIGLNKPSTKFQQLDAYQEISGNNLGNAMYTAQFSKIQNPEMLKNANNR